MNDFDKQILGDLGKAIFIVAPFLRPLILILAVLATTLALCARASGEDVPAWCIRGLAAVESSSYFRPDGSLRYVNQKRGTAGERGFAQAMPATLREHGFSASLYEQDTVYALSATRVILGRYYARTGSWWNAVAMWHRATAYQAQSAQDYARRVSFAGGEAQ